MRCKMIDQLMTDKYLQRREWSYLLSNKILLDKLNKR